MSKSGNTSGINNSKTKIPFINIAKVIEQNTDVYIQVTGDSMAFTFKEGALLALREIEFDMNDDLQRGEIVMGECYFIVTKTGQSLLRRMHSWTSEVFYLHSDNYDKYPPVKLKGRKIEKIYIVYAIIIFCKSTLL